MEALCSSMAEPWHEERTMSSETSPGAAFCSTADPQRQRREAFFGYTRSICPHCKKLIDAHIVLREGADFMQKKCPEHGRFEVQISSDAQYYVRSLSYTKPGTLPLRFDTRVE